MKGAANCTDIELSNYLEELEEGFSPASCLITSALEPSKSIHIASKSYQLGKRTVVFPGFQFLMISKHSTEGGIGDSLTSLAAGSHNHVRTSVLLEKELELPENALDSGKKCFESFAKYDLVSHSWKMSLPLFPEDSISYSGTWPRSGTMRNGVCSERTTAELRTIENEFGYSLPTPSATSYGTNQGGSAGRTGKIRPSLETMARTGMFPTPRANDSKNGDFTYDTGDHSKLRLTLSGIAKMYPTPSTQDAKCNGSKSQQERNSKPLNAVVGGKLNPEWVEWLMGWPIGWTGLEPLGMGRLQLWLQQHGQSL